VTSFEDLLERYAAVAFEKQRALADLLGEHNWQVDIPTGQMTFSRADSSRVVCDVQLLGTESYESNTWLWAWANTQSNLPAQVLVRAEELRGLGGQQGLEVLTTPSIDLEGRNAHELAMIASGLCNADAYYRGDYGAGALYCLLTLPQLRLRPPVSALEITMVMTQLIAGISLNHRRTFLHYLNAKGLHAEESSGAVRATLPSGGTVNATFDDLGRLTEMRAG
jgi:hypothetical protein